MKTAAEAVLDYLDGSDHGMNLSGLIKALPDYTVDDLKEATRDLFEAGKINRVYVLGPTDRTYPVFYSLYMCTVKGYAARDPEPEPANKILSDEQAQRVMARLAQEIEDTKAPKANPVEAGKPIPFLYAVPEAPEAPQPRPPRYGIMDVIDRWRLNFRLSRIIEIVGSARNRKLTKADAATVCRMINEHVGEA